MESHDRKRHPGEVFETGGMGHTLAFDYHEAFSRNLGWVTQTEQDVLRHKRVAIAGMGGVGGSHLLTLSRLGVGAFNLADFDQFELANFNRQAGASMPHIGRNKLEVMSELAMGINPELSINAFSDGVNADNLDAFLESGERRTDRWYQQQEMRLVDFSDCADSFLNINGPEDRDRLEARMMQR